MQNIPVIYNLIIDRFRWAIIVVQKTSSLKIRRGNTKTFQLCFRSLKYIFTQSFCDTLAWNNRDMLAWNNRSPITWFIGLQNSIKNFTIFNIYFLRARACVNHSFELPFASKAFHGKFGKKVVRCFLIKCKKWNDWRVRVIFKYRHFLQASYLDRLYGLSAEKSPYFFSRYLIQTHSNSSIPHTKSFFRLFGNYRYLF